MLVLLPPSEGKTAPRRGAPLDLASLRSPSLGAARATVLDALVTLCSGDVATAAGVLGLGARQRDLVLRDAALHEAPTARADRVYSGVLYDALDVATLSTPARRRASSRLRVCSALLGLVAPSDRIPAYRLSGDVTLPGVGPVAGHWREHLGPAVRELLGEGLLLDLRSSTYTAFWRPGADLAARTATVRVLQEHQGRRRVVSHLNKATKGRLVRDLLEHDVRARRPGALVAALRDLGWRVEDEETPTGTRLDVVVDET